jgi:hypothetical protein
VPVGVVDKSGTEVVHADIAAGSPRPSTYRPNEHMGGKVRVNRCITSISASADRVHCRPEPLLLVLAPPPVGSSRDGCVVRGIRSPTPG